MTIPDDIQVAYNRHLVQTGMALADGSFRIRNRDELRQAVKKWPSAKDPEAAKKHIIARANALRAADELPTDWIRDHTIKSDTFDQAKAVIAKTAAMEAATGKPGPLQVINKLLADPEFPTLVKARRMNPNLSALTQSLKFASPAQKQALAQAIAQPLVEAAVADISEVLADLSKRLEHLEQPTTPPRLAKRAPAPSRSDERAQEIQRLREDAYKVADLAQRRGMLRLAAQMEKGER